MIRTTIILASLLLSTSALGQPAPMWFNSGLNNRDLTISPDGSMMATTVTSPANHFAVIMISSKTEDAWQTLSVAPFSGRHSDIEPMFTPDGQRMWFASKRPKPTREGDDWDLWYVDRQGDGWLAPVNPGPPINTGGNEFYPSITREGTVYFTAEREAGPGREDIFRALAGDGGYSVEPVGAGVNTEGFEFNAFVMPDESLIFFSSQGRDGSLGGGDLYVARADGKGGFLPAAPMPAGINSPGLDYCPFVHDDVFYFASRRFVEPPLLTSIDDVVEAFGTPGNGLGDVFRIPLIEALPGF